jgi:CheY-like chemotaxis protein/HPt (histidine-containing phosphotransfer) domain-containing protein
MNPFTVLVVEDNVINQKVVVKMLERLGVPSTVAENGRQAVQMFEEHRYELIFMDIQMPEMDGLEATKAIRARQDPSSRTVIVALTANAMQGDRDRCLQAGMDDYLAKPIKQSDIESILAKWVSAVQHQQHTEPDAAESGPVIIDPKRIEQIREIGDWALLKELMGLYLSDLDQFTAGVSAALSERNFEQIYEWSHKLKGSSANLGVDAMREACRTMEASAKESDAEAAAAHFGQMQLLMNDIRTHIIRTYQ